MNGFRGIDHVCITFLMIWSATYFLPWKMKYLDGLFEEYRKDNPGMQMPTWDEMRKWALAAFENADGSV